MRYTGRFTNGTIFDARYADQPLTCEIGAFYLPGVDRALTNRCVGTTLRLAGAAAAAAAAAGDLFAGHRGRPRARARLRALRVGTVAGLTLAVC